MNQLNPIKHQSEVFDRALMDQIECQTYGITVAQVKTCIDWHGGDYLEYMASVAKLAQRHANDLPPSPAAGQGSAAAAHAANQIVALSLSGAVLAILFSLWGALIKKESNQ